jgi:hypothetical protein
MSLHAPVHSVIQELNDPSLPAEEELAEGLRELRSRSVPLKWGDLVRFSNGDYRNDGLVIFNGEKLIDLSPYPDDYGTLPSEFRVLVPHPETKEIIPLGYWHLHHNEVTNETTEGICHNDYVWLDHSRVGEELIRNLHSHTVEGKYQMESSFIVEGQRYEVVVVTLDHEGFDESGTPKSLEEENKFRATVEKVWSDFSLPKQCLKEDCTTLYHPVLYTYSRTFYDEENVEERSHRLFFNLTACMCS